MATNLQTVRMGTGTYRRVGSHRAMQVLDVLALEDCVRDAVTRDVELVVGKKSAQPKHPIVTLKPRALGEAGIIFNQFTRKIQKSDEGPDTDYED